jgi:hypothetical protein
MPVRTPVDLAWWTSGSMDGTAMHDALAGRDIGAVFRFLHRRGWSWAAIAQAADIGEQRVRAGLFPAYRPAHPSIRPWPGAE